MERGVDVHELIASVERAAADPLARLEKASAASEELAAAGDALLTHFVEAARASGASWAQIGDALDMTKQGAQQRFAYRHWAVQEILRRGSLAAAEELPLLQRFTPRARASINAAADEAGRLRHDHVATEHLLLGLLSEREGFAVRALEACGHPPESVRAAVEDDIRPGDAERAARPALSADARRALDFTMREAVRLGHNYIGTEHMLLGLMKEEEGAAASILGGLGLTHERLSDTIVELLAELPQG